MTKKKGITMLRVALAITAASLSTPSIAAQYRYELTGSVVQVNDPSGLLGPNSKVGSSFSLRTTFNGGPVVSTSFTDGGVTASDPLLMIGGFTIPNYGAFGGLGFGRYVVLTGNPTPSTFVEFYSKRLDAGILDVDAEFEFFSSQILRDLPDQYGNLNVEFSGGFESASYNYRFTDPAIGGNALFSLDRLMLTAVPEPASWAMMIGGIGLVGSTMRYRRRSTKLALA